MEGGYLMDDYLNIRGTRIPVTLSDVNQMDLLFFSENPRIYSMLNADRSEPSQEEIEKKLLNLDHVKHLIQSIKKHGGLIDPVIVRDGKDRIVIEGNSRLAAYRKLSVEDPLKWGKIRCKILPKDIEETHVFALLGEYHVVGKKDWLPYEQAGYLYRMHTQHNIPVFDLADEIGLNRAKVKHLIEVYKFMLVHHAIPSRWSYYDEFIKSRKIAKARQEYPDFDIIVVEKIKSGEIERAVDIRSGLKKIAETGGKTLKKFAEGQVNFSKSIEKAENTGKTDSYYKKLNAFRSWIIKNETKNELSILGSEDPLFKKCIFEVKKIHKRTGELIKKLDI